jgi:hypothetical protein
MAEWRKDREKWKADRKAYEEKMIAEQKAEEERREADRKACGKLAKKKGG